VLLGIETVTGAVIMGYCGVKVLTETVVDLGLLIDRLLRHPMPLVVEYKSMVWLLT
jgi:hypothetical protein